MYGSEQKEELGLDDMTKSLVDKMRNLVQSRLLQKTREPVEHGSGASARMQRMQIGKLRKDVVRARDELELETRQAKQANDHTASNQIKRMHSEASKFVTKIKLEQRKIEELDKQMATMNEMILKKKQEMSNATHGKVTNLSVQRRIRQLEDQLENARVKLNETKAANKRLQDEIKHLRRNRKKDEDISKRLDHELRMKQEQMAQIIKECEDSAMATEDSHEEMLRLKELADAQQQSFQVQWTQLSRLMESGEVGILEDGIVEMSEKAKEEERELKKRVNKGTWGIARDRGNIHHSMEKVQAYEEAFAKIQKATMITDIDILVNTFISAENDNFTTFNHVNELTSHVEQLDDSIAEVTEGIAKYRGKGMHEHNRRKKIISDLKTQVTKTEEKIQHFENIYKDNMKTISSLKSGIKNIFDQIGCKRDLSMSEGVTEANMMQYLGIIEQKTGELKEIYEEHRGETDAQKPPGHQEAYDLDSDAFDEDVTDGAGLDEYPEDDVPSDMPIFAEDRNPALRAQKEREKRRGGR